MYRHKYDSDYPYGLAHVVEVSQEQVMNNDQNDKIGLISLPETVELCGFSQY
jgi:hypothetical protein